jgi:ribosomal protein S3
MKIKQAFYRLRYFVKNDVAKFLTGVFADKHLKHVKIIIRIFYEERERIIYEAGITNISTRTGRNKIKVTITTLKPGALIGRKAENIDAIAAKISKILQKPVIINIKECTPFH